MDTLIIHIMILLSAIPAFIILLQFLKKIRHDEFLVYMFTGCLLLLGHVILFSVVRIIFEIFPISPNVGFFNWWSLFVRLQTPVTFLWIGLFAKWRKRI